MPGLWSHFVLGGRKGCDPFHLGIGAGSGGGMGRAGLAEHRQPACWQPGARSPNLGEPLSASRSFVAMSAGKTCFQNLSFCLSSLINSDV